MKKASLFSTVLGISFLMALNSAYAKGPSPANVDGATTIDAKQAKELWLKGAIFIDTREKAGWDAGRIPGALHINIKKPEFNAENLASYVAKDHPVISYCNAEECHRAAKGAKKLVEFGYTNVYYFRAGFPSWKNAGYPYE